MKPGSKCKHWLTGQIVIIREITYKTTEVKGVRVQNFNEEPVVVYVWEGYDDLCQLGLTQFKATFKPIKGHPHAELMKQYAEESLKDAEAWRHWEFNVKGEWWGCINMPEWDPRITYRRRPRTITINGNQVPEPLRVAPEVGTLYYVANLLHAALQNDPKPRTWNGSSTDFAALRAGIVHLLKYNAAQHSTALLSFTQEKN